MVTYTSTSVKLMKHYEILTNSKHVMIEISVSIAECAAIGFNELDSLKLDSLSARG